MSTKSAKVVFESPQVLNVPDFPKHAVSSTQCDLVALRKQTRAHMAGPSRLQRINVVCNGGAGKGSNVPR